MTTVTVYFTSAPTVVLASRFVDLMGAAEVAAELGVTRQQAHRLAQRSDFPKPVAVLAAGKIWRGRDIRRWQSNHADRRPGRPEKPYPRR